MSGIIAVYALVIGVLIAGDLEAPNKKSYSLYNGFMHLACGLSVGLAGLAAGYAIGIVGDSVRVDKATQDRLKLTLWAGRSSIHAAIPDLCWYGPDLDFRRSSWSIRVSKQISLVMEPCHPTRRWNYNICISSKAFDFHRMSLMLGLRFRNLLRHVDC